MKKEIWKDIPGYEDIYQVSNHGKVRSLDRYVSHRNKQKFCKGKIICLGKDKNGYLIISLFKNGCGENNKVHRLVLTVFDRPPKEGEQCNHKDGIKDNNYIENLEWVTPKENTDHAIKFLNQKYRKDNKFHSILNEEKVNRMKIMLRSGKYTHQQLADIFKVCRSTISSISAGNTWKS